MLRMLTNHIRTVQYTDQTGLSYPGKIASECTESATATILVVMGVTEKGLRTEYRHAKEREQGDFTTPKQDTYQRCHPQTYEAQIEDLRNILQLRAQKQLRLDRAAKRLQTQVAAA